MQKLSLNDLDVKNKRVLVRVDFNVPLNKEGAISDDTRIREALPTIEYILSHGGAVILMSHLGRPKGKRDPQFSLRPCAEHLEKLLKRPVQFAADCIGPDVEKKAAGLKSGDILLLENLRFYAAEEEPESDPSFAAKLAKLGDLYVNDAFGTAHRAHASTATIAQFFPNKSAAGFLMEKEAAFFSQLLQNPKRPFYAIIGGAKVSSKMGVLESLLGHVDGIFIGGGMAFTFLKAQKIPIGNSIHEDDLLSTAQNFLNKAHSKKISVWLPEDLVIADKFDNSAHSKIILTKEGVPEGWQGMDIGPQTARKWSELLLPNAATIFWNGPLGVFEMPHFAKGTNEVAKALSLLPATTIVGGGDSVAAINTLGLSKNFTHVSTGGGASLEFLEFGHLPGIDALSDRTK